MKTAVIGVAVMALTMVATEIFAQRLPASSPAAGGEKTLGQNDSEAKDQPEPAVYCTLLCCDKLVTDLRMTADQRAELAKLQEQLKATILGGGVRAQQHGPSTNKARTLARMTSARLTVFGKKVKDVLTSEQDQKLTQCYASGKLRPIEVVAAEVHDPMHGTKGKSFGEICLVPHYDDPAAKGSARSGSTTQGVVRGADTAGSYYRDAATPNSSATDRPEKEEKPGAEDDIDTLLANLKKAGHDANALLAALTPIEAQIPRAPNPAAAEALETVLLENSNGRVRALAAKALENWGRPESIAALQKAAKSSDPSVVSEAKKAIKTLTADSTPGNQAEKAGNRPVSGPLPRRTAPRSPKTWDRDASLADIKSADASKRLFAILRLVGTKPPQPDLEMAKALEHAVLEDSEPRVRSTAAWALQNWGTPESIPALKKALDDPNRMVHLQAQKAIDMISSPQ